MSGGLEELALEAFEMLGLDFLEKMFYGTFLSDVEGFSKMDLDRFWNFDFLKVN